VDIFLDKKEDSMPENQEFLYVLLASLLGIAGHHFFLSIGLTKTTTSNAGVILGSVPLFTSIFAVWMLKERLTLIRLKFDTISLHVDN